MFYPENTTMTIIPYKNYELVMSKSTNKIDCKETLTLSNDYNKGIDPGFSNFESVCPIQVTKTSTHLEYRFMGNHQLLFSVAIDQEDPISSKEAHFLLDSLKTYVESYIDEQH